MTDVTVWLKQAAEFVNAFLTLLIAFIALYIAWQQWKTNQQRLNLDRYDRRLHIYEEVKKILSIIFRDANASREDLLKFRTSVSEADFLFGPEVIAYIDEIYRRGIKLAYWTDQYRDSTQEIPEGYDHARVVEGKHQELTWLTEQFDPAREMFRKYLDVSK